MTEQEQFYMNSELFERMRKLENSFTELASEVKRQGEDFKKHDQKEMDKFEKVENAIDGFRKMLWVGLGVVLASSDNIWNVILKIVG